jgi:hypothetical protein
MSAGDPRGLFGFCGLQFCVLRETVARGMPVSFDIARLPFSAVFAAIQHVRPPGGQNVARLGQ